MGYECQNRDTSGMPAKTPAPGHPPVETPHYHGHRKRLRERLRSAGADALSDYELLEMVLFAAQPRGDMKPLAKLLLRQFGSFAEVVHAPEPLLRQIDGIGEVSISQLKVVAAAATRIAKGQCRSGRDCRHGTTSSTIAAPAWRFLTRNSSAFCFSTRRTS